MDTTPHLPSTQHSSPPPVPVSWVPIKAPYPTANPAHASDLEQLGERIAELAMQISAATYQLLTMVREFDEGYGWEGFRTCAHWLSWRTGLALGPAREKVRVGKALAELPRMSEAMGRGRISYSKVRALTRIATPENEEDLLQVAAAGTASHVESLVRAWRRLEQGSEQAQDAERHASRYFETHTDEHGMLVVRGRLEPEAGAALVRALEAASQMLYEEKRERPTPSRDSVPASQRRADAIGLLAEAALSGGLDGDPEKGTRGDRYQVVVHVDAAVLEDPQAAGESAIEGTGVPSGTSRRIACDASKVLMTHDSRGGILDVGRKTRIISPALRRALAHHDGCCRFPGCGLTFCYAHHVKHWAEGGETKLDNLTLLCRRHHRSVHEEGYTVVPDPDGSYHFFRPDGREIPQAPPLPDLQDDAVTALLDSLLELGVDVDWADNHPEWDGRRLDLGYALDALMPRED